MNQMAASIKLHYLSINLRHYPIVTTLLKPIAGLVIPEKIIKQHTDYRKHAAMKLKRRLSPAAELDRPDIVSQLLRSEDRGECLTSEEVMLNCILFINAASETTGTALTGAFNHLIHNPASLSALQTEIRQVSLQSDLTLQRLKNLPYLNAVIKEALRMCNPK